MKNIKIGTLLIIPALLVLFAGCSKKTITVTNDPELEKSLYGTWALSASSEIEIWSEPNTDNEKYLGKATVLSTNSMSFSNNQNFEMANSTTVQALNLYDDAFISEEDIKLQVEKSVIISGRFSVDKDYLELKSESVLVNGKVSYTAEEYSQIDSSFGSIVQTQKWNISGNSLNVSDLAGTSAVSFTRQ